LESLHTVRLDYGWIWRGFELNLEWVEWDRTEFGFV
jgi:hypothetical protein